MTTISNAATALSSAFDRLGRAGIGVLNSATGSGGDLGAAMADMAQAKTEAKASLAVIRIADSMLADLLALQAKN